MKTNITKIIKTVMLANSITLILWLFVSWVEITSKNLKPNPEYHEWNAFVLISEYLKEE